MELSLEFMEEENKPQHGVEEKNSMWEEVRRRIMVTVVEEKTMAAMRQLLVVMMPMIHVG